MIIRRQDRDIAVLLSLEEYDRLHGLNAAEFQRSCDRVAEKTAARDMTEETLADILSDEP
mgnify:CR=1 FL=1